MKRLAHLVIKGTVQGVGFRAFVEEEADARGLEGWVRNRRDGSVEAVVQGESDLVEALIAACREGPPASHVDSIEVSEADLKALELRPAGATFAMLRTC